MIEFLRDPIWQGIGAILAIFTLVLTIVIYVLQRNKKSLAYEIQVDTELLTVRESIAGKVQVLFDSKPVQNVRLVVMRIFNSGNIPITASDFEQPLFFTFDENTLILIGEVVQTIPPTLRPSFRFSDSEFILNPTLLNSGDTIVVRFLLSDYKQKIFANSRIMGVKDIKEVKEDLARFIPKLLPGFLLSIVGLFLVPVIGFVGVLMMFIGTIYVSIRSAIEQVRTDTLRESYEKGSQK
jgi:hypothetical protein